MAAPPPQNDADLAAITFGIAAMDEILEAEAVSFPADAGALQAALGDRKVPYGPKGNTVDLGTVLGKTDQDRFESRRELLNALHPVFEEMRRGGGLGAWLQSLFSFSAHE